ncbi:zinc ribbon domain-containing protein [Natronorarus salvus]|uniref:zinc ribbon domain-containing protein n=1 Tax=Natronorarus salvus TaxID=3117733 RepID=UPI002F25F1CB
MLDGWLPWLFAAFVAVHLLGFAYLTVRRHRADGVEAEAGDRLTCDHCHAENDSDYRYCGECAEELPGGVTTGTTGESASGRGLF